LPLRSTPLDGNERFKLILLLMLALRRVSRPQRKIPDLSLRSKLEAIRRREPSAEILSVAKDLLLLQAARRVVGLAALICRCTLK
jgi:hypothetical protein